MKVSIITVTYNSEKTIQKTIESVRNQSYKNVEHIFIDGISKDNTLNIINRNIDKNSVIVSEKDFGVYDAMNKGINLAKGEILFILNSDDTFYENSIIEEVVKFFDQNKKLEILYGNLIFTKNNKIVRKWNAGKYYENSFLKGWCPPHPSFIVKKKVYQKYGIFNLQYKRAADIEIMYRFLDKFRCNFYYYDRTLVNMKIGGKSNNNIINIIKQNFENIKILRNNKKFKLMKFILSKLKHRFDQLVW